MMRFQGMNALVTGASRGLGRSCAVALGREGAHVVVGFNTRRTEAEETLDMVESSGGSGCILPLDVRDLSAVGRSLKEVVTERGGLDVLVNNAGVVRDQMFCMMQSEEWNHVLDVNLVGTLHCCRAVVTHMMGRRRGSIVNVASVAGVKASVGQSAYAAAKGGVIAFTRTLAAECGPYGVRVNAIVPGLIDSGMTKRVDRDRVAGRVADIPLGRLGRASEIDHAILFLASGDSAFMTGQALVVDGGLSL